MVMYTMIKGDNSFSNSKTTMTKIIFTYTFIVKEEKKSLLKLVSIIKSLSSPIISSRIFNSLYLDNASFKTHESCAPPSLPANT